MKTRASAERTIVIDLPPRVADELRKYCAMNGASDAAVIEAAIRQLTITTSAPPTTRKFSILRGGRS
jgi:hypothetical protein